MAATRRWYIYLVCAVSIQSVVWAVIALLRNLIGSPSNISIAFKIAVILVGLPIFLVHWLWAQRLAGRDIDERGNALRRLYIYGSMAAFLGPFLANTFDFTASLLWMASGRKLPTYSYSIGETLGYYAAAMVILAMMWFYHWRVAQDDSKAVPEISTAGTVRRLYIFGFSAAGVAMLTMGIIHLIRWMLYQFEGRAGIISSDIGVFTEEVARLIVGLPLWLLFWQWAQRLFTGPSEEERESALRKFYLYSIIFIAVLSTVTNATMILAGFFRRLLDLPSQGDIRIPLPTIIGMILLWAYHAYVLKCDAALAGEAPRQAGVRRLYTYLVAAIGLAAFLVGLSGDISLLIRFEFGQAQKESLCWFTAALIAGLPVWLIPWRSASINAEAPAPAGTEERHSIVRKIYLYFYLFAATMTVLSSLVYIVYQFLLIALGEQSSFGLLTKLGQSIAFTIIGVGVWLYHGSALRRDGRLNRLDMIKHLSDMRLAVVDADSGDFGKALMDGIQREYPDLNLDPIGLTPEAAGKMNAKSENIPERLTSSGLIVAPWIITIPDEAGGAVTSNIANAVIKSSARKLLIPVRTNIWEWAGVDRWNNEAMLQQTLNAVKQILADEEVKAARPMSAGAVIGIIIGVLLLLILLAIPVIFYFSGGF